MSNANSFLSFYFRPVLSRCNLQDMDVTFTNVLEGARQYFQGLPAATGSTVSPSYVEQQQQQPQQQQQQHVRNEQNDRSSYWPPQHNAQQEETTVTEQQQQTGTNYQQQYQEMQQQFQFSRPQSREAPSNVQQQQQQQQQYQSHILPNPSYHQQRVAARPTATPPSTQSYYQLQSSATNTTSTSYHNYQQTPRSYYTMQNHQMQNYNQQQYNYQKLYPTTSQDKQQQQQSSSKPQQQNAVYGQEQTNQQHRTTHNLPPIAAISNYHSNRSNRERTTTTVQKVRSSVVTASVATTNNVNYTPQYTNNNNSRVPQHYGTEIDYRNSVQYNNQQKPQMTPTSQSYYASNYPQAQSSAQYYHHQQQQQPPSKEQTHNYQQQPMVNNVQQQHQEQQQVSDQGTSSRNQTMPKQKRESPLDLSVKTVRTPADSTLDDEVAERSVKYGQNNRANHSYPTYDMYASSFQRNLPQQQQQQQRTVQSASAPKVDFLPNFNVSSMNHPQTNNNSRRPIQYNYDKTPQRVPTYNNLVAKCNTQQRVITTTTATMYATSYVAPQASTAKKPSEGLPRIDFPPGRQQRSVYPVPSHDVQRKRPADTAPMFAPSKIPKVEDWRQQIDRQIEQKLSSYTGKLQTSSGQTKPIANGAYTTAAERTGTYNRPPYTLPPNQNYSNTNQYHQPQTNHNQTYVPSVGAHQYPGYNYPHQNVYTQHGLNRTNSTPVLPTTAISKNNGGGADKRVLSLLRNSLEIKGAKEAQKKFEQEHRSYANFHHQRPEIQHPSTDVTAPLQPKPGIVGRQNVSPFTASSLLDRNTPPTFKFHIPKAIDSVRFDTDTARSSMTAMLDKHIVNNSSQNDLDGLAAFLAARIRTKAELKEVGPSHNNCNNNTATNIQAETIKSPIRTDGSVPTINGATPPKLIKEKQQQQQQQYPPRRRLFSRNEEDVGNANAPPRDKSGLRSSSETSVFDFPDTDSESEMPVLERQSLEDMRRDRKSINKQQLQVVEVKPEPPRTPSPLDELFDEACNNFMEQLKKGCGKKRGRRKKADIELARLENAAKENEIKVKEEELLLSPDCIKAEVKVENDSDSDVPLSKCKNKDSTGVVVSDNEEQLVKREKLGARRKLLSSSDSDSDNEEQKNVAAIKGNNTNRILSSAEIENLCNRVIGKPVKKPTFGDGSAFHPGWEEELYKYKKSLRMPSSLIHLTRPPNCNRTSASLPDLDPCPASPTPSSVTDNTEYSTKHKVRVKSELADSDMDSNSSFSFSFSNRNYDSEGSSSVKSLNVTASKDNNSILDKLLERYVTKKRRKGKKKEEPNGPKVIPKCENPLELLATPSLEIDNNKTTDSKKMQPVVKLDSVLLGFRKKTVNNFKDAFINNSKSLAGINEQFTTVVLKSRTRTETRVLKQRATIKEVFGEDRPASAPPITCNTNEKGENEENDNIKSEVTEISDDHLKGSHILQNTKQALKDKLLDRGKKQNNSLLKMLVDKKIKTEYPDDEENVQIKQDPDEKSETPSLDGDDTVIHGKKKIKLRNMRRKFSSGFDYIRKKKKQVKKEGTTETPISTTPKMRRRGAPSKHKATPESIQDIQKEIKMWVLNKGIGETHLHRAARLGYTVSVVVMKNSKIYGISQ